MSVLPHSAPPSTVPPGRSVRPPVLPSRQGEVELVLQTVTAGWGAVVWTGEPGAGASTLLDGLRAILTALPLPPTVLAWDAPPGGPSGSALEALVRQVRSRAGVERGETPTAAGGLAGPGGSGDLLDALDPDGCAAALHELLGPLAGGHPVVLVLDDLPSVDPASRAVLAAALRTRGVPLVVLAAATSSPGGEPVVVGDLLPGATERPLGPVTAVDALHLLADQGLPAAPHVAAHLVARLVGNPAALVQTAALLDPEQLAGVAVLPDPLPVVPAVRELLGPDLAALTDEERGALLVAAVAVVDRADLLLATVGCSVTDLVEGPLAAHLAVASGRFAFADPRMRSLVHGEARLGDRTAAHEALAAAHEAAGDAELVVWHRALSSLVGGPGLTAGLNDLARRLLDRGEVVWGLDVAREAASQADGDARAESCELAGLCALRAGLVHDAAEWLRQAARAGAGDRVLAPLVTATALVEGHVPDDVVGRHARPGGCGTATGLAAAARLHAERGDGPAAARLLALAVAHRDEGAAQCPGGDADLAVARAWCAAFGVGGPDAAPVPAEAGGTGADDDPADLDRVAEIAVCRALALAEDDDLEAASQVLASAVAVVAPTRSGRWGDGEGRAASPLAEAHLRLVQALVHLWSGDLTKATRELTDAAFRLPVGLPLAGMGVAAARRLDLHTTGAVGVVATALEETCCSPTTRPLRQGLLVDRALRSAFERRWTRAATLLDLTAEHDLPDDARPLRLPGLDDVETWVAAGRPDVAERALARRQEQGPAGDTEPGGSLRARLALASPSALPAVLADVAPEVRRLTSPFDRGRTELCAGRALARRGAPGEAAPRLLSAVELFSRSGAHAWAQVAQRELDDLLAPAARRPQRAPHARADARADARHDGRPEGRHDGRPDAARQDHRPAADGEDGGAGGAAPAGLPEDVRRRWAGELTERELDVASLVALGASNREVAERLYLSVRTVEVHLGRVFRKLGVRSRVELTVLAHRRVA